MTHRDAPTFAERYGPWALVAGASDGIGAVFARAMGERGVNVALLARRQRVLEEVASSISVDTGVETRVLTVDLAAADAAGTIADAMSGLEVGMVMYCAGGDPNYEPFLATPLEEAVSMVQRNCVAPVQLCHQLAGPMVSRGRGGIVLVSSGAGLGGAPNMVAYGASKAFDIVLGEALWTELRSSGVDVLNVVLGMTDTPSLRQMLAKRGVLDSPDDPSPIPGAMTSEDTVSEVIANLENGPTWFVGETLREGARHLRSLDRNDAVRLLEQFAQTAMTAKPQTDEAS
jgi:uncharacterized protein